MIATRSAGETTGAGSPRALAVASFIASMLAGCVGAGTLPTARDASASLLPDARRAFSASCWRFWTLARALALACVEKRPGRDLNPGRNLDRVP